MSLSWLELCVAGGTGGDDYGKGCMLGNISIAGEDLSCFARAFLAAGLLSVKRIEDIVIQTIAQGPKKYLGPSQ